MSKPKLIRSDDPPIRSLIPPGQPRAGNPHRRSDFLRKLHQIRAVVAANRYNTHKTQPLKNATFRKFEG